MHLAERFEQPTLDFVNNPWLLNRDQLNEARLPPRFAAGVIGNLFSYRAG
jgi:hypothetical protein